MFYLSHLHYVGRKQGIDVFYYDGVRIDAILANDQDGRYLYLGIGKGLPETVFPGLLDWFGINRHQYYAEYEFPDQSFYLVQRMAA